MALGCKEQANLLKRNAMWDSLNAARDRLTGVSVRRSHNYQEKKLHQPHPSAKNVSPGKPSLSRKFVLSPCVMTLFHILPSAATNFYPVA